MSERDVESWPPPAKDIPDLPVDDLALRLLRFIVGTRSRTNRASTTDSSAWQNFGQEYADINVRRALGEAFDWLSVHGLIAEHPDYRDGYLEVTRRGHAAAEDPRGIAVIRAERRLDLDLHPLLARKVRRQFLLGEYDAAVLIAFKEVEIRVRALGGFDNSKIGRDLMHLAFSSKSGSLADPNLDQGERDATMELFAGAIGAFKNPSSHRQVDYDDVTEAAEAVLFADLLMRILNRYERRQAETP